MKRETLCLVVAGSLALNGCANLEQGRRTVTDTFASDDPCSSNARNIGVTAGALLGAGLGIALGKAVSNDKNAALVGAALGAGLAGTAGWQIGSKIDRQRCELHKIAQRYQINLSSSPIRLDGQSEPVGLTISLPERSGGGHFKSGSDVLTADARSYFTEIASQYSLSVQLSNLPAKATANEREVLRQQLADKKLILIGHTDDTGDSHLNADLSERRARAVAKLFREQGVPETNLYYQGAGETLPIADNRTSEGRQLNRRVEIIDVNTEAALRGYLAARTPRIEYYRPVDELGADAATAPSNTPRTKPAPSVKMAKQPPSATERPATSKAVPTAPVVSPDSVAGSTPVAAVNKTPSAAQVNSGKAPNAAKTLTSGTGAIDFGGSPANAVNTRVDAGRLLNEEGGLSLIPKAQAAEPSLLSSCLRDRPRAGGEVRALGSGKVYATNEHLTGLYNTSWQDRVNGHLVMLNKVEVLRDGAVPVHPPELKIYLDYNPQINRTAKPDLQLTPAVNTYRGSKGVLYRVFARDARGVQCLDVLFPLQGGGVVKAGKLAYRGQGGFYVTDFTPKHYGK